METIQGRYMYCNTHLSAQVRDALIRANHAQCDIKRSSLRSSRDRVLRTLEGNAHCVVRIGLRAGRYHRSYRNGYSFNGRTHSRAPIC